MSDIVTFLLKMMYDTYNLNINICFIEIPTYTYILERRFDSLNLKYKGFLHNLRRRLYERKMQTHRIEPRKKRYLFHPIIQ